MHHSPSGPSLRARLEAAFSRLPRLSLRGEIAPVVLVCGVLAGIALVLPSYVPAVTGADGALGTSSTRVTSTGVTSTGATGSGSASEADRDASADVVAPETGGAPSSTVPAPAPVAETPPAEESTPAPEETQTEQAAPPSSSHAAPPHAAPPPVAPPPVAPPPVAAAAPAQAPSAGAADTSAEGQILALVNQQRASAGCGALSADEGLASVARAFSADMRDRGFFSHTDPDGLSPFDRGKRAGVTVLGENIAYGQPDPASVMTDWMNSAGHRANILNCSYKRLGVGVAYGPGGPWWTQDFA